MTLKTIIDKLTEYALGSPNVGGVIINDVFRANFWEDAHYAVVAIIQREHTLTENNAIFRFQLAYIDRLTEDKSNEVDIQSEGVMTISNLINALTTFYDDMSIDGNVTFSVFNERFKDECGGVLADIAFFTTSPMGTCHDVTYLNVIPNTVRLNANGDVVEVNILSNDKWSIEDNGKMAE